MPRGRPKGALGDKVWADALRRVGLEYAEGKAGPKKIEVMARKLVDAGMAGDMAAAREFGDRLDGKARQQIDATITDERMVVEAQQPAESAKDWQEKHGLH